MLLAEHHQRRTGRSRASRAPAADGFQFADFDNLIGAEHLQIQRIGPQPLGRGRHNHQFHLSAYGLRPQIANDLTHGGIGLRRHHDNR
jgi:hypothetical protein